MRIAQSIRIGITVCVLVGIGLAVASCADKGSSAGVNGVTSEEAMDLNNQNTKFSSTDKDPPLNADTHFAAGQLNESQGNLQGALEQYGKALKLNPKHESALFRSGVVLAQLKQ